jgi:hypothetical protein
MMSSLGLKIKHIDNCILLLCFLIVLLWSSPLWLTPGKFGISDWGFYTSRFEAMRRTILGYRQWIGNNPWNMGSTTLFEYEKQALVS